MVFWCGGRLFSAPDSIQGKELEKVSFCRIADVTLGSSLVRFRGLSALHCHGVQREKRC